MVTPVRKVPLHLQSAANRLHIKNGVVVNDDTEEQADIYIEVTDNQYNLVVTMQLPGWCHQAGGEAPHHPWRGQDCGCCRQVHPPRWNRYECPPTKARAWDTHCG